MVSTPTHPRRDVLVATLALFNKNVPIKLRTPNLLHSETLIVFFRFHGTLLLVLGFTLC